MSDFFDEVDISVEDTVNTRRDWNLSFKIRLYSKNDIPEYYHLLKRLLQRNIKCICFRCSDIYDYDIEETDGLPKTPDMDFYTGREYVLRKVYEVNLACSINSPQDSLELISALIITKHIIGSVDSNSIFIQLICYTKDCRTFVDVNNEMPNIFNSNRFVNYTDSSLIPSALYKIWLMSHHICTSTLTYTEMSYMLNVYSFDSFYVAYLVRKHLILLETEDYYPHNSTLHGWKYIETDNIPYSWRASGITEQLLKKKRDICIEKKIDLCTFGNLIKEPPNDMLVTISMNSVNMGLKSKMSDDTDYNSAYAWKEIYKFNGESGVVIINHDRWEKYPDMIDDFFANYKSHVRHSRNIQKRIYSFVNTENNAAGIAFNICTYINPKIEDKIMIVTFGIYGNLERIKETTNKLFNDNIDLF